MRWNWTRNNIILIHAMIIITTVSLHRLVQKYQSALYAENDKYVLLQNAVKHTDCRKRKYNAQRE